MELPTSREIGLETLVRERDAQLGELTDELARLRQYLTVQPGPSLTDPISLPPALLAVLLPHINNPHTSQGAGAGSTVTAALTQRATLLQEENDELYEMLKSGETGKLKEEVRGLRRVVDRLQGALKESQQIITAMSTELEASYQSLYEAKRPRAPTYSNASNPSMSPSNSPISRTNTLPPTGHNGSNSKLPPTGPRAATAPRTHKKPRLSEVQNSPGRSTESLPAQQSQSKPRRERERERPRERSRDGSRRRGDERGGTAVKMEVDDDVDANAVSRPRERERDRDRGVDKERERERERERDTDKEKDRERDRDRERVRDKGREREHDRDRERDRDRDRSSRRNGNGNQGGGGGGSSGRGARRGRASDAPRPSVHVTASAANDGDRTLASRMGL
ncbi:hypothetical protein FIBSPDRAFT_848193 [Athelia psychrophila]|uniref:Uncharacterized protein n=1 Tax=Athelia psychrophila TaxID=1759441 RepID=A0A166VPI7_9AGAM|nr:hypothetical protein FIBSPDRAFT_848193 [Fibularhizoctonia sp. CBS 109695]